MKKLFLIVNSFCQYQLFLLILGANMLQIKFVVHLWWYFVHETVFCRYSVTNPISFLFRFFFGFPMFTAQGLSSSEQLSSAGNGHYSSKISWFEKLRIINDEERCGPETQKGFLTDSSSRKLCLCGPVEICVNGKHCIAQL